MIASPIGQPLPPLPAWQAKLQSVLRSWEGTRWQHGQCCKGRAVDCYYFGIAVLDELYGITAPRPGRMPVYTGTNNRPASYAMAKGLADRYPCRVLGKDPPEPGDLLMVRRFKERPDTLQHLMIAGPRKSVWHAGNAGVAFVTLHNWAITHGLRMLDKERWGQS